MKDQPIRATVAEIDLDAIAFNLSQIKSRVGKSKIMAVVKANAYGHGALPVATRLLKEGADHLAVAFVTEGIQLREGGVEAPILIFGGFFPDEIPLFDRYRLEFTLYTMENLVALVRYYKKHGKCARVHIKVDTGMGRVGVPVKEAAEFVKKAMNEPEIEVVGLYSHFATSDEKDKTYALKQLDQFRTLVKELEAEGISIPYIHMANSGAILDLPDSFFTMVRPGIMLYGYYPSEETSESLELRPAMTLKSRVIYKKTLDSGESVSYGRQFIAARRTQVATVPIGYADGYNRLLSNRGHVSIRGKTFPVIGRVCMDQIVVDVGDNSEVAVGDEVILFGPGGDERVSVPYLCRLLQTIPYEVCCWVSARVPRFYK